MLGRELPEGDVAYVLTLRRAGNRHALRWNAHTRALLHARRPRSPLSACPLSHVGVVFNDRNVWANRQLADRPREMQWNLEDPACWKKLFDGAAKRSADSLPAFTETEWATKPGLAPLQRKGLRYHRMHDEYRADLEAEIEERLKEELQDLRGARPTDWNISVGKTLKARSSSDSRSDASGGVKLSQDYHDQTLDKVSKSMHLVGLPLHHALVATPPPVGAAQADLVEGPVAQAAPPAPLQRLARRVGQDQVRPLVLRPPRAPQPPRPVWVYERRPSRRQVRRGGPVIGGAQIALRRRVGAEPGVAWRLVCGAPPPRARARAARGARRAAWDLSQNAGVGIRYVCGGARKGEGGWRRPADRRWVAGGRHGRVDACVCVCLGGETSKWTNVWGVAACRRPGVPSPRLIRERGG